MDAQKHRLAKFGLSVPSEIDDERTQGKADLQSILRVL